MADLTHNIGTDLSVSAGGDLLLSSTTLEGQQRVLRRLLTNPADYLWQPTYGAGLARFVGEPGGREVLEALARSEMESEAIVSQNPPPTVTVTAGRDGTFVLGIRYVDADAGTAQTLNLPVQ